MEVVNTEGFCQIKCLAALGGGLTREGIRGKVYSVHPLQSMGQSYSWGLRPRNPSSTSEWIIMEWGVGYIWVWWQD